MDGNHGIKAAASALKINYLDPYENVKRFVQHIESCSAKFSRDMYYSKYSALLQPTMSGKTKLLLEVAKSKYVVYINLKNKTPPFSSHNLVAFLTQANNNAESCARIAAFVIEFNRARASYKNPPSDWLSEFVGRDGRPVDSQWIYDIYKRMMQTFEQIYRSLPYNLGSNTDYFKILSELAELGNAKHQLWFFFDEGSALLLNCRVGFSSLQCVFRFVGKQNFAVITDTVCRLRNYAPDVDNDPSLRAVNIPVELLPTFTEVVSVDLFRLNDLKCFSMNTSLEEKLRLAAFVRGRPFWGAYLTAETSVAELLAIVKGKVLCKNVLGDITHMEQSLSVLSSIVCLNVNKCTSLAETLVSRYLSTVLGVSEDRRWIYISSFSEPIVAEASYGLLAQFENMEKTIMKHLVQFIRQQAVNPGDNGELSVQLLHLFAWKRCILHLRGQETEQDLPTEYQQNEIVRSRNDFNLALSIIVCLLY
jgi:hypothetical protein